MKALVYHGPGEKAWESVPDPDIIEPTDAIVRIDTSTICGSAKCAKKTSGDGSPTPAGTRAPPGNRSSRRVRGSPGAQARAW